MAAVAAASLVQEVNDRAAFISAQQVAGVCTADLVQNQVHALLRSIRAHSRVSVSEATAVSQAVNAGPAWSASHKSVLVAAVGELSVKGGGGGQAQDVRKQQKFRWRNHGALSFSCCRHPHRPFSPSSSSWSASRLRDRASPPPILPSPPLHRGYPVLVGSTTWAKCNQRPPTERNAAAAVVICGNQSSSEAQAEPNPSGFGGTRCQTRSKKQTTITRVASRGVIFVTRLRCGCRGLPRLSGPFCVLRPAPAAPSQATCPQEASCLLICFFWKPPRGVRRATARFERPAQGLPTWRTCSR